MSYIPTVEQANELMRKYNNEEFHRRHAEVVSGVMGWFAQRHDAENTDYWRVVGMLHDIDFELHPEAHCVAGIEMMQKEDIDERIIRSALSHGYGLTETPYAPEHIMEKILFATDELTGLIGAVAIMRPSKSVADLELSSVKKKFKDKKFAAGCSRDAISQGAERLGWELDRLIEDTITAMRSLMGSMSI